MAIEIKDINISVRTYNCLKRAGYTTLEEVAQAGEEKIAKVRNLGAACLEELKTVMPNYGLAFAEATQMELPMLSHEQLSAPKGFIMVHSEGGDVYYVNVDSIAGFSTIEYNDGHCATVITLVYKLTTGVRDYITVKETSSEICTLINNARR